MKKYDESFEPPAPTAEITVRKAETGERIKDVLMLLDTGSDISLLPRSSVNFLKLEPLQDESFRLEGFDGSQTSAEFFYLQVIFLGKRFTGRYCVIEGEIGILGRNIMNKSRFCLTGKS